MRKTYTVEAVVLAYRPLAEASAHAVLLTDRLGVLYARAQSVRKPGAKLAPLCQTGAYGRYALVKGAGGWRMTGGEWEGTILPTTAAREAYGRVARLAQGLCGEEENRALYEAVAGFARALPDTRIPLYPALERLAALRVLVALGYADRGELSHADPSAIYDEGAVAEVARELSPYTKLVNQGIAASGLR